MSRVLGACQIEAKGIADEVLELLGKPFVPNSMVEKLHLLIEEENLGVSRQSGVMQEVEGQINFVEIPETYFTEKREFLGRLLDLVVTKCQPVPAIGIEVTSASFSIMNEVFDSVSVDTIYLALEKSAVLVTEDGSYRIYAGLSGIKDSVGLQGILYALREKGKITEETYSNLIIDKLSLGDSFVSVTSGDMLLEAQKLPGIASAKLKAVISTFENPNLELHSGINVCSQFICKLIPNFSPRVVREYYTHCLDSLKYNRPHQEFQIHEMIRQSVLLAIEKASSSVRRRMKRELRDLLAQRSVPRHLLQGYKERPLVHAIRVVNSQL